MKLPCSSTGGWSIAALNYYQLAECHKGKRSAKQEVAQAYFLLHSSLNVILEGHRIIICNIRV